MREYAEQADVKEIAGEDEGFASVILFGMVEHGGFHQRLLDRASAAQTDPGVRKNEEIKRVGQERIE